MGPCWDGDSVKLHFEGAESNINRCTHVHESDRSEGCENALMGTVTEKVMMTLIH